MCLVLSLKQYCTTMELQVNPSMRQLLKDACSNSSLPQDVRDTAYACQDVSTVSWKTLKLVAGAVNAIMPDSAPPLLLHQICNGSQIILPTQPIKSPNPELEARRKVLRAQLENMQYDSMVSDITQKEKDAEAMKEMLPTTQAQLTYGAHVLVMMFTGFMVCYYCSKTWFHWDELWAGLLGVVGMTIGLLLETTLLILRSNMPRSLEQQYPDLFDPKKFNRKKPTKTIAPVPVVKKQQ